MKKLNGFICSSRIKAQMFFVFCVVLFIIPFQNVNAQNSWRATVRTGINFPTEKLGAVHLQTGFGFDANVAYHIMPHLLVNTGWAWNHFPARKTLMGSKTYYEETGYMVGLQFLHPFNDNESKWRYLVGGGAIYNHIEVEDHKGNMIDDTRHGWGWQGDAGLSVSVGGNMYLVPTIRYRSLSREVNFGETKTSAKLRYLSCGLAIAFEF